MTCDLRVTTGPCLSDRARSVSAPHRSRYPRRRFARAIASKRLAGLDLGREHLDELLAVGADPAPVADEPDGAEQVALDQERVEPRDPAIGVDLVEHQGVLNGRALCPCPNLT